METMPPFRTLVVEDFDAFRRFICVTLEEQTQCQVVGEAAHGLDAVHQAEGLQPDLILLDISLPRLNGMEAGRRIRALCPKSKILFVSQRTSFEIVKAAMALGGHGYLHKSDAAELSLAVSFLRSRELSLEAAIIKYF